MNKNQALIDYLQRAIGYSLTGNVQEQVMFFLYGTGANGKSTFLNAILAMLGEYAMHKHGQGLLYTSGELPRLMRSGPPRRAVTAVWEGELARAALPGRDR
jgi:ABC-type ATPase involved in cell division